MRRLGPEWRAVGRRLVRAQDTTPLRADSLAAKVPATDTGNLHPARGCTKCRISRDHRRALPSVSIGR